MSNISYDSTRPNLLIIISTGIIGGPGKGILQLTGELHKSEQVDYLIAALKVSGQSSEQFIEAGRERGRNIEVIEQKSSFDMGALKQLSALIEARKINVIQTHGYKEHLLGLVLSKKYPHLKWVALAHGWTAENFKMKLYHLLDSFTLRFPDSLITVSEAMLEQFGSYRKNKRCRVITNAVEAKDLPSDPAKTQAPDYFSDDDTFVWGAFGRLTKDKGHSYLIDAFKQSLAQHPKQGLLIVGDGPEKEELANQIKALGLEDKVYLAGYQSDMEAHYCLIDTLVLPSVAFEGLPNVLLEALSYEIPVISTPVAGVAELIKDNENGWLVPLRDAAALRAKMDYILENEDERLRVKANARASLYPTYAVERRVSSFISEYQSLLQS